VEVEEHKKGGGMCEKKRGKRKNRKKIEWRGRDRREKEKEAIFRS